ncbi:HutD family protein [Microbacterium mangrovi]|uniref:HutD family protein n=1 Tax=Microbacterium mangrovi TaxID=1348253 RepID=UPI00068FEB54|nr:HutD family protein [Microbacterium mangrovi]
MSGWSILKQIDDIPPVPWANGAGTTRELIGYAESATLGLDVAPWRLSVALLERPGGFSPLPGIDRTFLLVGGDAALSVDGALHRLTHGDVLQFTGDQEVVLESVTRGCHAVNLMVEREGEPPRLVHGPDPDARFAVALASTREMAVFDLLVPASGPGMPLPPDLASIVP